MSTLEPIRWMYSENSGSGFIFVPKSSNIDQDIYQYFLELATRLKNFDVMINHDLPDLLRGHLTERLHQTQKQQIHVINKYMIEIERISKLFNDNSKMVSNENLQNELKGQLDIILKDLSHYLQDLELKARFIRRLKADSFQYYNAAEYGTDMTKTMETLKFNLIKDNQITRILCSNDVLNDNNRSKLNQVCADLIAERKNNRDMYLIYADFSYCPFVLPDMIVLSSNSTTNKDVPYDPLKTPLTTTTSSLVEENIINILLLGETGIGKSTFINACVNYLTFNTLKQAESNEPVVLIPVSFPLATENNFHEHTAKLGKLDYSDNEDFYHPGQSVTQHCRSYLLDVSNTIGRKLRIIDTPGFGDIRGPEQDSRNMQNILEYISDLTHLNAVCICLKPNSSRLHMFLRLFLTKLFDLLSSDARQNIILCFTNARSNCFTTENTAPLLRTMLHSLSIHDIPFKQENTFCFDSESFRYLVAVRNGIEFNDQEKETYEKSWTNSVHEFNRLLHYITKEVRPHSLNHSQQSITHAQLEINQMVRPILEAMRNILRNFILWRMESSERSIKLCPQPIKGPNTFCSVCKRDPFQLGKFWILPDHVHQYHSKCLQCSCACNQHNPISYVLSYEVSHNPPRHQPNDMKDLMNRLCFASIQFAYFLVNIARSTTEDPFLIGLLTFINEEKQICQQKNIHPLNLELVKELESLVVNYKEQMEKVPLDQQNNGLEFIYKRIQAVSEYPMVREQMTAIRQTRTRHYDKKHDFQIPAKSTYATNNSLASC